MASCATPAAKGMVIRSESPEVVQARRLNLEFLLASGRHNCLVQEMDPDSWTDFQLREHAGRWSGGPLPRLRGVPASGLGGPLPGEDEPFQPAKPATRWKTSIPSSSAIFPLCPVRTVRPGLQRSPGEQRHQPRLPRPATKIVAKGTGP